MLHSGQLADMEFEVQIFLNNQLYPDGTQMSNNNCNKNESNKYDIEMQLSQQRLLQPPIQPQTLNLPPMQIHTFRAHRVIVSSR